AIGPEAGAKGGAGAVEGERLGVAEDFGRLRLALPVDAVELGFGAAGPVGGHGGCHRERGQGEGGGEGSWQAHWRSPGSIGAMPVMQLYTLKPGGAGRKQGKELQRCAAPQSPGGGAPGRRDIAAAAPGCSVERAE